MDDLARPRLAARHLLRWWARDAVPAPDQPDQADVATPVDAIAARLGLEVARFHPDTRRGGTLGWLEPGEDVIFLRGDLPEPVRRFTLAHELGHALLHRAAGPPRAIAAELDLTPDPAGDTVDTEDGDGAEGLAPGATDPCDNDDLEAPLDPLSLGDEALRPGQTYSARARRESEANAFAAALLLPPDLLRAYFLGDAARGEDGQPPRALAERFGVSEDAVHQALTALLPPGAGARGESDAEDASAAAPASRLGSASVRPALDRWQRAAAAAPTPALVVAGPGTGKTSTLVGRVAHLVFTKGVDPRQVLALTFSNKAAQEMRDRLNALLAAPAEADAAGHGWPAYARPAVSTIHSFCGDLLRRYAPRVGLRPDFRLITEAEGYLLLREVTGDLALGYYQPLGNPALHFPALLAAISRAKDELAGPARYAALAGTMRTAAHTPEERARADRALEAARVYAAYQQALAARGDADFGDLIFLAVRLLREQPDVLAEVRGRFTHLLVDEFQDINHAMGMLLATLAGPDGPLWAVGDADQAIYRFRGAAPSNLAQFTALYPGARIYPLGTNYRSRPPILRAAAVVAGAFLGEAERRVLEAGYLAPDLTPQPPSLARKGEPEKTARGEGETEPVITLTEAPDEAAELEGLAASIRARTERGYALADQAVLCRTRRQGQRVAAALAAAGLPARIVTPLLDQPDVKDVLSVILLLADPSGAGLLRAGRTSDHAFRREEARAVLAAAQARHGVPLAFLLDAGSPLAEVEGLSPAGLDGLARLGMVLADLWTAPDVATGLARYLFTLTGLARRAMSDATPTGRAHAANLARLLALARAFEHQRRGADPAWYRPQPGDARWDEFVDYLRVLTALGREPGAAEELVAVASDGVRVLTVHGSKGLEFPVVYLPGLAEGRFPAQRRGETAPPPIGLTAGGVDGETDSHLVEEACLFYVALTRARDALVISHAERYGRRRYAPSPFLRPLLALAAQGEQSGISRARWGGASPAAPAAPPAAASDADEPEALAVDEAGPEPLLAPDEALSPSAIETYGRCPRQFAYRYVYHLRPREVSLATLRRGLHETLRELQARFAASGEAAPPTAAEAAALFEHHWRAAVAADATASREGGARATGPLEGPFGALYRRHGLRVVNRAWGDLLRERGLPVPADAAGEPAPLEVVPAQGALAGAEAAGDAVAVDGAPLPAPLPLDARIEERVRLRVQGRDIELTLDRVEGMRALGRAAGLGRPPVAADAAPDMRNTGDGDAVMPPVPAPLRFVRHRLGRGPAGPADLRALLYTLAAEQERQAALPELYQHNLTTGELERVRLDSKRRERLRDDLTRTLAGVARGDYPAKPEPSLCQGCPFLLICPG